MNRCRTSLAVVAALCIQTWSSAALSQEPSAAEAAVRETLRGYVDAFNSHDASKLSAFWSQTAVYVDRQTGERIEGREALEADFGKLFDTSSDLRLVGETSSVDFVTDNVAVASGVATVSGADRPPSQSDFTATLVNQQGSWKLAMVEESPVPQPETASDALQSLAWLVGDWEDDTQGDIRVKTSVSWSEGEAFLIRSFSADLGNGATRQGTQIIGWDPRAKEIRSWAFNANGSFGDGVWSRVGDAWHVTSSQTLANGDAASGTYVVTPVDENSMTIQLIGHEIEGEPQPASAVITVVRSGSQSSAQSTDRNQDAAKGGE